MNNRNSIMAEDSGEFISLTLRTRNSKKPSRMLASNWKHPCHARSARIIKNLVTHGKSNTIKSKLACLLEASESTRLCMDQIPQQGDSHARSSHEPSLEPTPTRSVDLGKHSVCTHFPKDRNCEICQRTEISRSARGLKLQGRRAEDALAEPYFVQKKLVT